jgi:hypothetical protein
MAGVIVMPDKKKEGYGAGAFASQVHSQQKYLVFNVESADHDASNKSKGAERFMPYVASHELFHALGLDHPRTDAREGEKPDTRSWEQTRQDIASRLSSFNALGTLDTSGRRTITYSFNADPRLTPHGNPDNQRAWLTDPNAILTERMEHVGESKNTERNEANKRIRSSMMEAFADHERLFNVKYVETSDAGKANLLVYGAEIPRRPQPGYELTRGSKNAYTHDVTIMSYNQADPKIWAMSGVGDVYAAQQVYGKPAESATRNTITAEQLAAQSGVLWDHKPMTIKLAGSKAKGDLKLDMGAHPYDPAITGTLKDAEGDKLVRQHIGAFASIGELDATGSDIKLDVTGTSGSRIKVSKDTRVTLNGRRNDITLGSGADSITHSKSFGHVVSGLAPEDSITAKNASKAQLEHWDKPGHEKGTLVTLVGDDGKNKGSVFVKDTAPDKLTPRLKGITTLEPEKKPAVKLEAPDRDKELAAAPPVAVFHERNDVCVTSSTAAGHAVSNMGGGCVIVKMSQPQYDSRNVTHIADGNYYAVTFRDNDETKKIHLQTSAKIAVCKPDGEVSRVVGMADSKKEIELDIALRNGTKNQLSPDTSTLMAKLPQKAKATAEQLG